jgi:hypothetical protein
MMQSLLVTTYLLFFIAPDFNFFKHDLWHKAVENERGYFPPKQAKTLQQCGTLTTGSELS